MVLWVGLIHNTCVTNGLKAKKKKNINPKSQKDENIQQFSIYNEKMKKNEKFSNIDLNIIASILGGSVQNFEYRLGFLFNKISKRINW